jgi:hypothetical protein
MPLGYNLGTSLASSRTFGRVPGMAAPASSIITRVAYGVSQLPRVVWYLGHGLALRRLAEAARGSSGARARQRVHTNAPVPEQPTLRGYPLGRVGKNSWKWGVGPPAAAWRWKP